MDNEENEINNANNLEEEQPKKSMTDYLHRANELRHDYQNAGGLTGMAKNAINNKINDKYNAVKDKAKDKIHNKTDELKKNAKDKIDSKIPESVKKKQEAIKAKGQNMKDKLNAPKNKINEAKGKLYDVKSDLNEKTFRKGVKTAVDAAVPGAGVAAEKMLDVGEGKKAIEAARAASNPVSALKEGTKKLLEVVITKEVKKKIAMTLIPTLVVIIIVITIVLSFISKYKDSQTYVKGDPYGEGKGGVAEVDEKYKAFYQNVENIANGYTVSQAMVIAVLTSYKDNDLYTDEDGYEDDSDSCTQEDDECIEIVEDNITKFSKSKMKKYIKKVAKAIENSGGDITEGDYKNRNTGSEFFWWLYDDFVDDYYSEYLNKNSNANEKKKEEIIRYIYLYYEDIKELDDNRKYCNNSYINTTCPSVTVTNSSYAGTYDLEEYVEAVVAAELGYSGYPNAMRAQAIAARTFVLDQTNNCTISIEGNTTTQNLDFSKVTDEVKQAVSDTKGLVMTYNGKIFTAFYSNFPKSGICSGNYCTATMKKVPSEVTHEVSALKEYAYKTIPNGHEYGGMSQNVALYLDKEKGYSYEEILKYFYADGIKITATSSAEGSAANHEDEGEEVRLTVYDDDAIAAKVDSSKVKLSHNGWYTYTEDGAEYIIVAAATEECLNDKSCGDTNQKYDYLKYYNLNDKFVLNINGVEYNAIVLDHCGACMWSKEKRGDRTNNRIDIWVSSDAVGTIAEYGGLIDNRSAFGSVCGYSGSGLVTVDGFVQRVSRPTRTNKFYYDQATDSGANGWLEGECAWYASGRAQEVLSTLNNGLTWSYNGNGNTYCSSANYDKNKFQSSTDYTKPQAGAIVSWASGQYGHVAVVENVSGNTVTISEAGLGFGPKSKYLCSTGECVRQKLSSDGSFTAAERRNYCEADGSGCFKTTTVTINELKNLYGATFQCYIYLGQPK